eukprot:CAMPEP_0182525280 /NCGR_PEP_ID=MMETSP1323-20130603/2369_1 /TAXON_ID=236787 /ORGANISM="Florenciella parvula, Strain RCC1693" /LENGTH=46 /DNA_ID= /DNA_START= /DNA_END= /DNA_ORIENTATION=
MPGKHKEVVITPKHRLVLFMRIQMDLILAVEAKPDEYAARWTKSAV